MDRLESLGNALSQITMYDVKSMYNQAKNVVFNVSEMEAKVRDATNDEPWGASSTLMQEIAQGTFNFQNFNEIMPAIYSRFMEKEARQWRQIYKALQLLEYLVKNGSERVVDDARSHIGTIKMLRNFYYVDEKGKDQGINVRNRSKELVELLGDVEKIRTERRKAKANKHKYTGTGNDAMSFTSGGSRYGGFGSDSFSSYSGGGYGGGGSSSSYNGGGGGSGSYGGRGDYDSYDNGGNGGYGGSSSTTRKGFQEYDAGDDDIVPRRSNSVAGTASSAHATTPQRSSTLPPAPVPAPPKAQPVIDLLGMDDDDFGSAVSAPTEKALPAVGSQPLQGGLDDDFDDFQTAPPPAAPANNSFFSAAPAVPTSLTQPLAAQSFTPPPAQAANNNNLFNMLSSGAPTATARPPQNPMQNAGMMRPMMASPPPSMMGGAPLVPNQPVMAPTPPPGRAPTTSSGFTGATPQQQQQQQQKPAASFDDLWSMSLSSTSGKPAGSAAPAAQQQKSIKDLEKEKAQAQMWGGAGQNRPGSSGFGAFGAPTSSATQPASSASGNGLDDLLF